MNEWMLLYSALCIAVHPKRFKSCGGGSLLNHHQCAASTWMMRRQPKYNGASALTTPATGGEEREIEPIKWMGIIRKPWLKGPVEGIWPGHLGYTPTLYAECHGIFNDHRESGPRFNVSSERRCFLQEKKKTNNNNEDKYVKCIYIW